MSLQTYLGLTLTDLQTVGAMTRVDLATIQGCGPLPLGGYTPAPAVERPEGTTESYLIADAGNARANRTVTYQGGVTIGGQMFYLWESSDEDCLLYRTMVLGTYYRWHIGVDTNGDGDQETTCYEATGEAYSSPVAVTWLVWPGQTPAPTVTEVV